MGRPLPSRDVVQEDELRGRIFALRRALDEAAAQGRGLMVAVEREGSPEQPLARVASAVADVQRAISAVRELDERSALVDRVAEALIVDHRIGDGGPATDDFLALLEVGMAANGSRVTVEEAARTRFVSRRALQRRLNLGGYPSAAVIITWGSLIRALHLYAHEGMTLREAARHSGFSLYSTISNRLERDTGLRPSEWKAHGADMDDLIRRLVAAWRES